MTQPEQRTQGQLAGTAADYWGACTRRVGAFVDRHYRWPGVYALHRSAVGLDLLKAPANVLLALPALVVQILALVLRRAGALRIARSLLRVPLGFRTAVEVSLAHRLRVELLEGAGADPHGWEAVLDRAARRAPHQPQGARSPAPGTAEELRLLREEVDPLKMYV